MKKILVVASGGIPALVAQETAPPAVFTAAQAAAGKAEYQKDCHNCHTDKLTDRLGEPGELPTLSSLDAGVQNRSRATAVMCPRLPAPNSWRDGVRKPRKTPPRASWKPLASTSTLR